ncbi:hypothetical protein FB563_4862 [Streptomyces puniciscabiei]|uniref:Uncharacterized protein n=1 Tax=Streptomyces puniciscabiei TaxID=164348 RepID=A0A542UKZ9_9ACTN|nr:hypothetical protein [Streptomyces puniciscabiei]TQK99783.1 hypothetical protein FB563_4862 [Streptomyces puniciscabiei]
MPEHPWFVIEPEDDEEFEFTDEERAFAAALRERTAGWAEARVDGDIFRSDGWDSLVACLSFGDPGARRHLIDVGVHFYGDRVRGDRLHNQMFTLTDRPSGWGLEATGTVEELADRSARWFRTVLDKPVVLYVWLNADRYAYAARFAYADDDQTIGQLYHKDLAPAGQTEELIAAGHVHGRGWIQTTGLPTPSLYQHIRGDLDRAVLPSGVRAVTERGPLAGVWYE